MSKFFLSLMVLVTSFVVAIILYTVVFNDYPRFGEFANLLWLGLITFGLAIGIFISGLLIEQLTHERARR